MKPPVACFWLLTLVVATSFRLATAQQADDVKQGINAYGAYNAGDIDSVSLTNGSLTLNIPIVSWPQRGKLHLGYQFVYNRKSYMQKTLGQPDDQTVYEILTSSSTKSPVVASLNQGYTASSTTVDFVGEQSGFSYLSAVAPDGGSHILGQISSTDYESVDGTGIRYHDDSTLSNQAFYDANGTKYYPNATTTAFIEDTNGNQLIKTSTGGVLDTVGRTIPALPVGSTTLSGTCPTGPATVVTEGSWAVPGPNGGTSTFQFCWASVPVITSWDMTDKTQQWGNLTYLQSLVLPNGTAWTFQYTTDGYGDLQQVTLPTGGTVTYNWTGGFSCFGDAISPRVVSSRTVNDGTGNQLWQYNWGTPAGGATVVDPLKNNTVYTYTTFGQCQNYIASSAYYQQAALPANLLKTVSTTYSTSSSPFGQTIGEFVMNVIPTQTLTTWANGTTSKVTKAYDSGFTFTSPRGDGVQYTVNYGKVTTLKEYDYGTSSGVAGPLLRQTNTSYAWQGSNPNSSTYLSNNMINLVYSSQITDGTNQLAYTTYGHDETGTTASGMTAAQNLDLNVWTGSLRGNQTSLNRWRDQPSVKTLTSKVSFYDTGMPYIATDPLLNTTTYSYSGTYQDAYLTQISNALSQNVLYGYDYDTGLKTSTTDLNKQVTTDAYDSDWRLLSDTRPTGGGKTSFCYTDLDLSGSVCETGSSSNEVVITKEITAALSEVATAVVDGLGRLVQTQLNSDPDGVDYVVETYDGDGNKATTSNPYRKTSDTTYGVAANTYDALHRVTQTTQADGSILTTAYCANTTLVTDEAGKWRRSTVDGLGRLVEVDEPNAATATVSTNGCPGTNDPVWSTIYSYNQRGDLLSVVQAGSRQRSFSYDSLSRLLTAANPESGILTYTYDDDGNVTTKVAPSPNQLPTGTKNATTTYTYDSLNRLTGKTYSDTYNAAHPTATAMYAYDGNALSGCTTAPPTLTDNYPIGHRTSMCDGSGATSWSHDTMGRVLQERRTIGTVSGDYETDAYNLDGSIASSTSLGYSVAYTYGKAARPLKASHSTTNFVSGATYAPPGEIAGMTLGSAITVANTYNSRLQPILLSASSPSGTVFSECFDFHLGVAISSTPCMFSASTAGDNGNVYTIVNNRDSTRTQNFTYDWLNRIQQAYSSGTQWGETFGPIATAPGVAPTTPGIDTWGNLLNRSGVTGKTNKEGLSASSNTNNQLSGFGYDPAGNTTSNGSATYVYDDENRLIAAGGVSYIYDGDGDRVEKCTQGTNPGTCATGATGTLYWRGVSSDPLTETNLAGVLQNTYIFFNGERVARSDSTGAVHYYFSDHLGSHGVVENATGSACEQDVDYYPYGGVENDYCGTQVAQNYKFTGKERDSESGLDNFGARYNASSLGRFMTPDWAGKPISVPYANFGDPQTLNLYTYVENSPLNRIDADGHAADGSSGNCGTVCATDEGGGRLEGRSLASGTGDDAPMVDGNPAQFGQAQNTTQLQPTQNQPKPGEEQKGEPTSLQPKGSTPAANGARTFTYQVVDPTGRPVRDVSVQEHVKVVASENVEIVPNPNPVHYPAGVVSDRIGPLAPPTQNSFLKTEQTFTATKGGNSYEMTTKVNQYVRVSNGNVTVQTVVIVP